MFSQHFDFSLPARINFVGGGGKSSLILKLHEEFSATIPAIYCTTTRIHPPHPSQGLMVLCCDNEDYLAQMLLRLVLAWEPGQRFVVTHLGNSPDLLRGVTNGFSRLLDRSRFPLILNEADGARSMSLKMPRDQEPVLIDDAEYIVPVIGLDCLNRPLGPETLFRWEATRQLLPYPAGTNLDPQIAASILLHPHGVCKEWRAGTQLVPFINKVDSDSEDAQARALAVALLQNRDFPVRRVVWGSVQHARATSITQ